MSFFYKTKSMFLPKLQDEKIIGLAGNPNVGKSTVFNALTGMNQKTGNWTGKTVSNARGKYRYKNKVHTLVDIPGTYSLLAHSEEEEVARDFLCFENTDAIIVVVDATSLERNLNLVLQILEVHRNVVVCVNLLDEAEKKKIKIDLHKLSLQLGVPVVGTAARNKKGLNLLLDEVDKLLTGETITYRNTIHYHEKIEEAINILLPVVKVISDNKVDARWLSLQLLSNDPNIILSIKQYLNIDISNLPIIQEKLKEVDTLLINSEIEKDCIEDLIVSSIVDRVEKIYKSCVKIENSKYNDFDRKLDKILTSKLTGIPIMLGVFGIILWLTIVGSNYPSQFLSNLLFGFSDELQDFFNYLSFPNWLNDMLVLGVYQTVSWIVAVMLPPMAIFFPLFTILEDLGYLPRVAFNLDSCFRKACAHGKQALTTCMGFGCNACGVTGCRIIDSPREKLIAILTNSFVPCNGRFPTLIAIITMFFVGTYGNSFLSTIILLGIILLGIFMTLLTSKILSKTLLQGLPSSYSLELPSYRPPQVGKVIVRSIFDRTIFVLGRAIVVAAPAGLIIWVLANINIEDISILSHFTSFLDPFGQLIGMDGVILAGFILGLPANEIVLPIILMAYMSTGSLVEYESLSSLYQILINTGWTFVTALCTMIFCLFHFPCATTLLTIRAETQSIKWMIVGFLLPTIVGIVLCFLINLLFMII